MSNFLRIIASYLYGAGVWFRNFLFDTGIIKSERFEIPIICVGNITVGGTGKTPTTEMIVDSLHDEYQVAVLSRGYGRRTKGYREVELSDSYRDTGDEPLQIKMKFPDAVVVVCEDRIKGIRRIQSEHPDVSVIVMDDGFQHRYVTPLINVIIIDSTRPVDKDHMLPYGELRDLRSSLSRANYFIVTKCSDNMSRLDRGLMSKKLVRAAYQKIYFMRHESLPLCRVFSIDSESEESFPEPSRKADEVIAMSGIGNPAVFVEQMRNRYTLVDTLTFDDHHVYRIGDLKMLAAKLKEHPEASIVTTEKDAVKLFNSTKIPAALRNRIFYQPVRLAYLDSEDSDLMKDFLKNIHKDVNDFFRLQRN